MLENRTSEFDRVVAALTQWQTERLLPPSVTHDARLVLEEAFTNVVKYAHPTFAPHPTLPRRPPHPIDLSLTLHPDRLEAVLEDNGIPFDPTVTATPTPTSTPALDIDNPLHERPDGLLGLRLIRRFSSTCHYERRGPRNVLSLTFNFAPPSR